MPDLYSTEEAMSSDSLQQDPPRAPAYGIVDSDPVTRWCYRIFYILMLGILGITIWMASACWS